MPQHRSRTLLERSPRLTQKRPPPANPTRPPPAPRVTYTMHTQIYKECECECKCVSCDAIKGSTQHSWSCGLSRGAPLDNGALQHVLNSLRRAAFQFGFRNFASRASPVKRRRPGDACYLIACAHVGRRSCKTSHVGVYPYYRLWLQLAVRRNHFLEPSRGVDTCPRWIDQASTPGPWDSWTSLLLCSSSGCSTQKTLRPRLSPAASIAAFPPSAVTRGAIASCEFW